MAKQKHEICSTCGERVEPGDKPHETTERVVRPHNLFARKRGGERVQVETRHLAHNSVKLATMTVEEWDALEAKRTAPPPPPGPTSVDMSRKYMEEEKKKTEQLRKQREHSAKRAAEKAAEEAAEVTGS
jgi:hypothetical protein